MWKLDVSQTAMWPLTASIFLCYRTSCGSPAVFQLPSGHFSLSPSEKRIMANPHRKAAKERLWQMAEHLAAWRRS
jgi:hypothetical protein